MKIKVLGPGCANCKVLYQSAKEAVAGMGAVEVEYVQDMGEIEKFPIFATPALIMDGDVIHQGKPLPSPDQIKSWIEQRV